MAGYSGTPLAKKLGIKAGHRVFFPATPDGFLGLLGKLPDSVAVKSRASAPLDVIVFFTKSRAELERRLPVAREIGLANRLLDNKVCAIDETWSGLRLVIRVKDRG